MLGFKFLSEILKKLVGLCRFFNVYTCLYQTQVFFFIFLFIIIMFHRKEFTIYNRNFNLFECPL